MYGRKRNTKTSEVTTVKVRCSDCKYASFSHTVLRMVQLDRGVDVMQ